MKSFFLFLSILLLITSNSLGQTEKINYSKSSIKYEIKNAGLTSDGEFKSFTANIHLLPSDLSSSYIEGIIQTNSIHTGINLRDNHLKGKDYFYTSQYPDIIFKSKKISSNKETFLVVGNLTIKGITKEISFEMELNKETNKKTYSASLTLNRRDFGIGKSSWTLADDAKIFITIVTD
jgi:polyisoprenoid-binding protein YceI